MKSMLDPLLRRTEGRSQDPGHTLMKSEFGLGCSPFPAGPDSSRFVENDSHLTTRSWRRRSKWAHVTAFLNESFMCRQTGIVGWHLERPKRARPNRPLAARIGSRASAARRRAQHTNGSSTTPQRLSWNLCVRRTVGTTAGPPTTRNRSPGRAGRHAPRVRPPAVGSISQECR